MPLKQKALEMRDAIDGIDLALHGIDNWDRLMELWDGARDGLKVQVAIEITVLRQIYAAMGECNRIINSPEYEPAHLAE